MRLLMDRGTDRGHFPDPDKSLFIADKTEDEESEKWDFERAGLNLNYVRGRRYVGA